MGAAVLAVHPVKLAIDISAGGKDEYTALFYHTINAIGAFVGYYIINDVTAELFGTWDTEMTTEYPENVNNTLGIFMDVLNHSLTASAYAFVAIAVGAGPFAYAQFDLNPDKVPQWFIDFGDTMFGSVNA